MVDIPLRSPILSLCITIISVVCELAFLTAALTFVRFQACRRLYSGHRVKVRAQHRYVLIITLFAMLAFVALETVTSIFSDPKTRTKRVVYPCVRNILGGVVGGEAPESEAIHFRCTNVSKRTVSHFEGNYTSVDETITCSEKFAYSYIIGERVNSTEENAERACEFNTCAFAKQEGGTLFLSGVQPPENDVVTYMPSKIATTEEPLDLKHIAAVAAKSYSDGLSEEGEIRRRAFLGSIESRCEFFIDNGPGTSIKLPVIVGAAIVWTVSLLSLLVSLFVRSRIFFDVTHPMHWARKVRHDVMRAHGDDPEIELTEIDGIQFITVFGYMASDEQSRLHRKL